MALKAAHDPKAVEPAKFRAGWSGMLRFGLVSFRVEAVNTAQHPHSRVELHLLHAACHSRIRYDKQCPLHGHVDNDEIISGYEYARDKYVEIKPEELDALHTEREKSLTIDAFITRDEINPIYFDGRMHYLLPKGAEAAEPYAVIQEAMQKKERCGIGQVIFSGKEQVALVWPREGLLIMSLLKYAAEIRSPEGFLPRAAKARVTPKLLALAETLVDSGSDDEFDFAKYEDRYADELGQLIEAKIAGKEIVAPPSTEEPRVINLMDALKKSVAAAKSYGMTANGAKVNGKKPEPRPKPARRPVAKKSHPKSKKAS